LREFGFEKLEVWKLSVSFARDIYIITKGFPKEEVYGLTSQLRRAAVSVSSNIAEGSSRASLKDQSRFSEIAYGSLMEIMSQLAIAKELGFLEESVFYDMRTKSEMLSVKLNALRKSQVDRHG